MEQDFTGDEIEEHRPGYTDGSKTQLSTGEFIARRTIQVAAVVLCSPLIIVAIVLALLIGGLPSYTELKNGIVNAVVDFATDRSPHRSECAHEWEFTRGTRGHTESRGLREDGLHYKVYDSLRYDCPHCGKSEWVHANEAFRTIEPSDEHM